MKLIKRLLILAVLGVFLLLSASDSSAQPRLPLKRIKSPSVTKGNIGGEAIDRYVVRLVKGQKISMSLSYKKEDENWAKMNVSRSPDDYIKFGKLSSNGTRWSGIVTKTGNYYIEVYAHPVADYTLRIRRR